MTVYLASTSPRRAALCAQIGLEVSVLAGVEVDETPDRGELPRLYAERMARRKIAEALERLSDVQDGDVVIAADTVLASGRRILAKTEDRVTAEGYLKHLSGRNARVWGGLAVAHYQEGVWQRKFRLSETRLRFLRISSAEIADYLDSGEWRGCAGAIAIQGRAARLVDRLQGSYSNVVGLDLALLWRLLPDKLYRSR